VSLIGESIEHGLAEPGIGKDLWPFGFGAFEKLPVRAHEKLPTCPVIKS